MGVSGLINGADFIDVWFFLLLNLYGCAFSLIIVLVEVRFGWVFSNFPSMEMWGKRGAFYAFNGLLSLGMGASNQSYRNVDNQELIRDIQEYIAYAVIAIGALYFVLAIFFLQGKAQKMRDNFNRKTNSKVSNQV